MLERNDSFAPGGLAERSMRLSVDMNGGVLGPHIAELAGYPGLADQHVQIAFLNSRFCVCDLGSHGGTWINDDKLEPHQWTELVHGTTLRLGIQTSTKHKRHTKHRLIKNVFVCLFFECVIMFVCT